MTRSCALLMTCMVITVASCAPAPARTSLPPSQATDTRIPAAAPTSTALPPTPTLDVNSALMSTVQPRLLAAYVSPDARWRVEVVIYDCTVVSPEMPGGNSLEQLFLISTRDGSRQLIDAQSLHCGGLGAAGFEGQFWTADSKYFYYTGAREGVPDGCGYWARPLHRLEPGQGAVEFVGGGPVSPAGDKIATWVNDDLAIWKLSGPRLAAVPLPVENAIPGPIAWSPDGASLVYLLSEQYCPLGTTYLVRISLSDLEPSLLLTSRAPSFADVVWDAPNRVLLADEDGGAWSYNLVYQQLTPLPE